MTSLAEITPATIDAPPSSPAIRRSQRTRFFEQASLILPIAGLGIGGLLALRGGSQRDAGLATLGVSFGAMLMRWQLARVVAEEARYQVEVTDGDFEVRHYAARVQAETVLNAAPWERSLNDGFDRLASYIFGGNAKGEKIAMTTPVMITIGATDRATRSVAFKMPDSHPLETLPEPSDRRITLRRVPPRRVAALSFSGRYGGEPPLRKKQELIGRVRAAGLLPIGDVTFAGYDAPWTLPWLRRNEVLIEVSAMPAPPSAGV